MKNHARSTSTLLVLWFKVHVSSISTLLMLWFGVCASFSLLQSFIYKEVNLFSQQFSSA